MKEGAIRTEEKSCSQRQFFPVWIVPSFVFIVRLFLFYFKNPCKNGRSVASGYSTQA